MSQCHSDRLDVNRQVRVDRKKSARDMRAHTEPGIYSNGTAPSGRVMMKAVRPTATNDE